VKIGVNVWLVSNPRINVTGAAVGTVLFFAVIVSMNLFMLLRVTKTKVRVNSVLIKPLFCAILCAAAAWLVNSFGMRFLPQVLESGRLVLLAQIVLATGAGVVIYAISMLLTRAVSAEDLKNLPGGKKIEKMLAKRGILG